MSESRPSARALRVAVVALDDTAAFSSEPAQTTYAQLYELWFRKHSHVCASFENFNVYLDDAFPPVTGYDLYMFTGSRNSAYEDLAWVKKASDYVREVYRHGGKILGICFGHQLIAAAFGGKVEKNPGGIEKGWASFALSEAALAELGLAEPSSVDILYSHGDAVTVIPPMFVNMGGNAMTSSQGLLHGRQIVTLQGHPEFNVPIIQQILKIYGKNLTEEYVKEVQATLHLPTTEVRLLEMILDYLQLH